MDIEKTAKQASELTEQIKSYTAAVNSKISDLQSKIDNAQEVYAGHTQKFINAQIQKLQSKIALYTEALNQWVAEKQQTAQAWIDKTAEDIKNQITNQAKKQLDQLNNFK